VLGAGAALALSGCMGRGAGGPIRLELWTLALSGFGEYIGGLLRSFEAAHPGVRVEWVDVAFEAVERKLISAAAAGRPPDVVNMSDLTFARYASLGAFRDLRGLEPTPAESTYLPGALGLCRIGGGLQAVPWYLTTQAVIANGRLLEAGGLGPDSVPRRWSELLALAPAFRERTGAFLFSHPLGHESQLPSILLAEGCPIFVEREGVLRAWLAHDVALGVLEPWVRAYRSGALPREAASTGHGHLTEGYQSERLALINTGPNFLDRIRDTSPGVFARTLVRPAITGALGRPHLSVMVLGVMSRSRHPALAAALAWHLTGAGAQLEFCRRANILPSTPASLEDPLFRPPAGGTLMDEARGLTASALPGATAFTPALAGWPGMRRAFEERVTRVLLGQAELGPTLHRLERDWDDVLTSTGGGSLSGVPRPGPLAGVG
jgi:ABC-type glycerol-3-phosphate transport system substrate-binding protein